MNESPADPRQCPTRQDGRQALFTHRVTEAECQSRQRGFFHRCFTCAYNNSWVARNGPPVSPAPSRTPAEAAEPTEPSAFGVETGARSLEPAPRHL